MSSESWPPELDALIAAPKQHTLLFENEHVRVLSTRIEPGETAPVHTHCWPAALYVISSSHFVRRDAEGNVLVDSRTTGTFGTPGASNWLSPLPPHTLENVGDGVIHNIQVELKNLTPS